MTLRSLAKDLLKAFLTLAALAALAGVYFCYVRPYEKIAREDTEAQVVSLLGKPYEVALRVIR